MTSHRPLAHSDETKEKIRQARQRQVIPGRPCLPGCLCGRHLPETKEKLRLAHRGHPMPLEGRMKLRQFNLGRTPSPETRAKLSRSLMGNRNASSSLETREKLRRARLRQHIPRELTGIELLLRDELSRRGLAFEMHRPAFGRFLPDFTLDGAKLFVQADGDYWHSLPGNQASDQAFNEKARADGWVVLRFLGSEIKKDVTSCGQAVADFLS